MIRRILITDDDGRPVPLPLGSLPSLLSLAAVFLDAPPDAVNYVGKDRDAFVLHTDGEDLDLPDGGLSDAARAQAFGGGA